MPRLAKGLLAFEVYFVLLFTIGCAGWKYEMQKNNQNLMKLEMGMSKEQVVAIMGDPDFNEAYQSLNGHSVLILFYYTERKWADGSYTKDECTPVVFEEGSLVGWGNEFYRNKLEVDVNINP